jgi:hypothetical protein
VFGYSSAASYWVMYDSTQSPVIFLLQSCSNGWPLKFFRTYLKDRIARFYDCARPSQAIKLTHIYSRSSSIPVDQIEHTSSSSSLARPFTHRPYVHVLLNLYLPVQLLPTRDDFRMHCRWSRTRWVPTGHRPRLKVQQRLWYSILVVKIYPWDSCIFYLLQDVLLSFQFIHTAVGAIRPHPFCFGTASSIIIRIFSV